MAKQKPTVLPPQVIDFGGLPDAKFEVTLAHCPPKVWLGRIQETYRETHWKFRCRRVRLGRPGWRKYRVVSPLFDHENDNVPLCLVADSTIVAVWSDGSLQWVTAPMPDGGEYCVHRITIEPVTATPVTGPYVEREPTWPRRKR
jgi:hypothetical protein